MAILRHVKRRGLIPGLSSDQPLTAIKLNTSTLEGGALVSLVFLPDATTPQYALRVARQPNQMRGLDANYSALEALSGIATLDGTIPKPVARAEFQGMPFTLETCLEGGPLAVEIAIADTDGDEARLSGMLERVCDWLWRLHTSTPTGETSAFMPTITEVLDYFRDHEVMLPREVQSLQDYLSPLDQQPVPLVRSHNDMHPNNLLYRRDGLGVVDWERSAPDSPLRDLFMLYTFAYLFPPDRIVPAEARYADLWRDTSPVSHVFHAALSRYATHPQIGQCLDARRAFCSYLAHTAVGIRETGADYARDRLPALTRLLLSETCQ